MGVAIHGVQFNRPAALVVGSEVVLVGSLNVHARFMGEFVRSRLNEVDFGRATDDFVEGGVVCYEGWLSRQGFGVFDVACMGSTGVVVDYV